MWPTVCCLPPACWLLEQVGFICTGLLAAYGALFAAGPDGVRHMHVGSMVPLLISWGGVLKDNMAGLLISKLFATCWEMLF